jgi:hypothetical protein
MLDTNTYFTIASVLPSLVTYTKKKDITPLAKQLIIEEVKLALSGAFKRATLNKQPEEHWQTTMRLLYDQKLSWDVILKAIYAILNLPPILTYFTYEAIQDLDTYIYRILYPFPKELEKSPEELKRLEAIARAPIPS